MPGSIEWEAKLLALGEERPQEESAVRGLADSLRGLARHYSGDGFEIDCRFHHMEALQSVPASVFTACYCICREALDNAARHSRSQRIALELAVRHDRLVVRVMDEGDGFEGDVARKGIARMEEHARLAGGRLAVVSAPNAGTCVSLVFPVPVRAGEQP